MCQPTPRVQALRERALDRTAVVRDEPDLLWARSWLASANGPWHIVRRGKATADVLSGMTPVIDEGELLVGKFCPRALTEDEQEELENWKRFGYPAVPRDLGQKAHMAIDYEKLLRLSITGVRRQVEALRLGLDLTIPEDLERDAFYRACLIALDGVVRLADRYSAYARELAPKEPDKQRRAELLEISRICARAPLEPAATFYEAMQAVHFFTFCLCAGQRLTLFQLGRPDRYLLPYYRKDLAAGRLTSEKAQELIDCLCIMLKEYTPPGLAVGFMVGGWDGSGADVSNELTEMFIESIGHTRLSYPGIGFCWNEDTPPGIMRKACELLTEGATHPAIFNDDVITAGLMRAGLPPGEACLYVHSTCVEITPIASSNVYVASPYINLLQLLHDVLGVEPLGASRGEREAAVLSSDSFDSNRAVRGLGGQHMRRYSTSCSATANAFPGP